MKRILLISISLLFAASAFSQELRCSVQVSASKIQGTNRQIFETLQNALNEFMNGHAWSNYKFSNNERI